MSKREDIIARVTAPHDQFWSAGRIVQEQVFKRELPSILDPVDTKELANMTMHLRDEFKEELLPALSRMYLNPSLENLADVADAIADVMVFSMAIAMQLGIPLDKVMAEVNRTNAEKLDANGDMQFDENGKGMKPPGWQPPNIWEILFQHSNEEAVRLQRVGADNWPKGA